MPMEQVHTLSTVLSGKPSQSLSCTELQSRRAGKTAPSQALKPPFRQVLVPRWHTPLSVSGPHGIVAPSTQVQPPLGVPSQLESSPVTLQESAFAGPTKPSQTPQSLDALPAASTQSCLPALHGPLPSCPACSLHACEPPAGQRQTSSCVSSSCPSQSLSVVELQSRSFAKTAPEHSPHCPLRHVRVPNLQMPSSRGGTHDSVLPSTHAAFACA